MVVAVAITAAAAVVVVDATNQNSSPHATQEPGFALKPGFFRLTTN